MLDDLHALLADPPLTPLAKRPAGKVLAKPVRQAARRPQRALDAVPGAEDRDTAIHEARKATKRARYAAEAAVPALGRTASRQATQAKELQQLLGDHHDSVVARIVLLDLAQMARAAGEDTFTYDLMHHGQACQAATIEQSCHAWQPGSDGDIGELHEAPQEHRQAMAVAWWRCTVTLLRE